MRIYLGGFMGAGKTTVGRRVARRLGLSFVDLDTEIERQAGVAIPVIFEREGESGFRQRERAALRVLSRRRGIVVATGGGTLSSPENRDLIRRSGKSVFLEAPLEVLFDRIERSSRSRPLFRDRDRARRLYEQRLEGYRDAELTVPVAAGDAADDVAARVVERLENGSCAT